MDATLVNTSIIILYWQAGCTSRKWEMVKSVRKWDVKNYVRFSWVAELKMNRFNKRTDYKLEASITCCVISWKPHFRNERSKKTALKNTGRNIKILRMEFPWLAAFQRKIPINNVVMVSYEKKAIKMLVSKFCKVTIFKSDSK